MKKRGLWILVAVIAVIAGAIALTMAIQARDAPERAPVEQATDAPEPASAEQATATPAPQLEIDPNAGALITPEPEPAAPGIAIPGWGSITLPAGVTEAQTSPKNPDENEGWYYLTFEMRLKDTDEVIFTTGLVPPGQYCNQVTLTRELEAGEYEAIIMVQPYRISDQSPTNNADMETLLIVE